MSGARDPTLIAAFAKLLRQVRQQRGRTQEDLAFAAGVDRTFIGLLETGKRQPSLSVLFALAKALDIAPEALVAYTRELRETGA